METRELIVKLIITDMKNHQLLSGLEKLGFSNYEGEHTTCLSDIVGSLLNLPENYGTNTWLDNYMDFVFQAAKYEITPLGDNLIALAEASYDFLLATAKREKIKAESPISNLVVTDAGLFNQNASGYGKLLSGFIGGLVEDTENVVHEIDRQKNPEKSKRLAIEEAQNLVKQLHLFTEDLNQLPINKLLQKYHL